MQGFLRTHAGEAVRQEQCGCQIAGTIGWIVHLAVFGKQGIIARYKQIANVAPHETGH